MLNNLVCNYRKFVDDAGDHFVRLARPSWRRNKLEGLELMKVLPPDSAKNLMLSSMFKIDPALLHKLPGAMAAWLGEVTPGAISPIGFTEPGKLRTNLADAYQVSNNYIEAVAKIDGGLVLSKLNTELKRISRNLRLKSSLTNELFDDIVETMAFDAETTNPYALQVIGARQDRLTEKLLGLGISPDDIKQLVNLAREYTEINNNVRKAALPYINETPPLKDIGYVPRVWTPQGALWLQRKLGVPKAQVNHMTGEQLLQSIHMRERENFGFNYIPPTEEAIQALHRTLSQTVPSKRLEDAGLAVPSLEDLRDLMINNPVKYRTLLQKAFTVNNFRKMSEAGILQALPMTSHEVYEFLVDAFELPHKHLSYYMKTDPTSLTSSYASSLAKAVGRSEMFNYMYNYGIANGFAVDYLGRNPAKHANWVPIGEKGFWEGVLDAEHLPKNFNLYVHPVAAQQLKSLVAITTSPAHMGNLAYAVATAGKLISKTVITGIGYPFALMSVVGNAFASAWGTGNPLAIATYGMRSLPQTWKLLTLGSDGFNQLIQDRKGLSKYLGLDDNKPYIKVGDKVYTEAAAVQHLLFFRSGELGAVGSSLDTSGFRTDYWRQLFAVGDVGSALAYANAMQVGKARRKGYSTGEWLSDFAEMNLANMNESLDTAITLPIFFNNLADFATRLTILKHAAMSPGLTNKWNFDSWQELAHYTDSYAYSGNRQGALVRTAGKYFAPFLGFMFWAPPASVRNLMRHPSKYMAYNHLIRLTSQQTAFGDDDSDREFVMREYQRDSFTMGIGKDPYGQPIIWNPSYIDPMLGGLRSIEDLTAADENKFQKTVDSLFGRSYFKNPYELLSGRDTFTSSTFDELGDTSWMWLELKGANGHRVRRLLNMIPLADAIDRANFLQVFGRAPLKDYTGKVIRPETLGLFGNQRFASLDKKTDDITFQNPREWFLRNALGLNLQVVDVAANVNSNLKDMQTDLQTLQEAYRRAKSQYSSVYNDLKPAQQESRKKDLVEMKMKIFELQKTILYVESWAAQRQILTGEALKQIKKYRTASQQAANGLLAYPDLEATKKLMETYNMDTELFNDVQKDANSEP